MGLRKGRWAVGPGAGRGLGAAIARGFAREGAKVVVVDVDEPEAQKGAGDLSPHRTQDSAGAAGRSGRGGVAGPGPSRKLKKPRTNLSPIVTRPGPRRWTSAIEMPSIPSPGA